jgi:8-oxo-dGTP pyrophosphatase MutT (NUDIX family)
MTKKFISNLKEQLNSHPLPGENAQFLMAPITRQKIKQQQQQLDTFLPRKSAVLILLYPTENSINTILIQRPIYDGVHSGQIAFPGGKFEENDLSLENTALREANEEIGINTHNIQLIGSLTDLYISPSNFLVKPFVGFVEKLSELKADSYEVNQIIHYDLFSLNNERIKGIKTIKHSNGFKIKTPYYEVEGFTVWGATAMMISELNAVVSKVISF